LKRALLLFFILLAATLTLLSCGNTPSSNSSLSGVAYRAFFSEQVSAGTISAGLYIVDARNDLRAAVGPMGAGATPGKMVVTPNRAQTLVFSGYLGAGSDNLLTVITNAQEAGTGSLSLPGFTESIVVSPDSNTAYIAIPTATVVGQSPGAVKVVSLGTVAFTGEVDIAAVRHLALNNSGTRLLAFSDNSNSVSIITPSNIGVGTAVTTVGGFDHPVAAFFSSDDSTAYVLNCGPECGGGSAGLQAVDLSTSSPALLGSVSVSAATVGVMSGSTLYLAGTPIGGVACSNQTTAATSCGTLTAVDLATLTAASPVPITDGYHDHIELAANGRVYIGAHDCTEISTTEVRGCLSLYNTQTGNVVVPAMNGDVTGIEPVAQRTVVYVIQNGALRIYETSTDALAPNPHSPSHPGEIVNLVGDFYDVKTIDF